MIKEYYFNYDIHEADVRFIVDLNVFTKKLAKATLEFFSWDYDRKADPIDEVMKKYAIEAIRIATFNNYNAYGVKLAFKDTEGFATVDGEFGITLISVSGYEFDEDKFEIEISEK